MESYTQLAAFATAIILVYTAFFLLPFSKSKGKVKYKLIDKTR